MMEWNYGGETISWSDLSAQDAAEGTAIVSEAAVKNRSVLWESSGWRDPRRRRAPQLIRS